MFEKIFLQIALTISAGTLAGVGLFSVWYTGGLDAASYAFCAVLFAASFFSLSEAISLDE